MKFIDVGRLNELYEKFAEQGKDGDFQSFVEKSGVEGQAIVDIEPCKQFLQDLLEENYRYLLQCEEEDLGWFGAEYLSRVNFLKKLLSEKGQLTMPEIEVERRKRRVGLKLIELKTDGSCFEFLIHETVRNKILGWGWLPDVSVFREYLKKNGFPIDKLYSEQQFLNDVEQASGFIRLKVGRKNTAEFICKMIYELFEV